MSYSTPVVPKESHDKILSVSGKKKCSYCGNELGKWIHSMNYKKKNVLFGIDVKLEKVG